MGREFSTAKALLKAEPHITRAELMYSKKRGEAFHYLTFIANYFILFLPFHQAKATVLEPIAELNVGTRVICFVGRGSCRGQYVRHKL